MSEGGGEVEQMFRNKKQLVEKVKFIYSLKYFCCLFAGISFFLKMAMGQWGNIKSVARPIMLLHQAKLLNGQPCVTQTWRGVERDLDLMRLNVLRVSLVHIQ